MNKLWMPLVFCILTSFFFYYMGKNCTPNLDWGCYFVAFGALTGLVIMSLLMLLILYLLYLLFLAARLLYQHIQDAWRK